MNARQRQLCEAVVETYATVEPLERHIRRTDWASAVGGVATVAMFGFFGYGLTGWWVTLCVVVVGVNGFLFGCMAERIRARRRAFAALEAAHEEASLELAVDDDE